MDRELLMAPRTLGLVGRLMLGLMAGVAPAMVLPAMAVPAPALSLAPAHGRAVDPATAGDDRGVLKGFLAGAPPTNRRLLDDLARTEWSPQEIRAALVKVYGVKVERVSGFLDSPAGRALVDQHVEGWSPWLAPQLKAYGLRSAILKASRQGALSAAGLVAALPVRFWLPQTTAEARRTNPDPVCPAQCGDSVLAHLAFLMASLQVGAMGR
jgi:hypothetical protein|uniref:hypothetical protein n=1 Tax=Cyanobium sp. TaxID=2164130 RepID=UPI00404A52CF